MRIGIGYDIHRLIPTVEAAGIPIGGVLLPCYFQVKAHSDGDVLLHSVVDACLGALALGDIGQWFPDSLPENKGRPSSDFVTLVVEHLHSLGWRIRQVDSVVQLEQPRLAPHSDAIRERIALLFGLELDAVSVKAKTMEGLGPIGERQAVAAQAVVTLEEIR